MPIVLQLAGRARELNAYLRNANVNDTFRYHLYSNNYTPLVSSVLADFTELAGAGYAYQNVAAAAWGVPTDDGTCANSAAGNLTFTMTGASGESAYGYFVTSVADGALLWSEKFAAVVDMSVAGRSCVVTPSYNNQTGAPC